MTRNARTAAFKSILEILLVLILGAAATGFLLAFKSILEILHMVLLVRVETTGGLLKLYTLDSSHKPPKQPAQIGGHTKPNKPYHTPNNKYALTPSLGMFLYLVLFSLF